MPYCTECGGELVWDRKLRYHTCKSCGVTFTETQLSRARDRRRTIEDDEEEAKRRHHNEYLDWWFKDKKNRR
jgi:hypothetical protein